MFKKIISLGKKALLFIFIIYHYPFFSQSNQKFETFFSQSNQKVLQAGVVVVHSIYAKASRVSLIKNRPCRLVWVGVGEGHRLGRVRARARAPAQHARHLHVMAQAQQKKNIKKTGLKLKAPYALSGSRVESRSVSSQGKVCTAPCLQALVEALAVGLELPHCRGCRLTSETRTLKGMYFQLVETLTTKWAFNPGST